MALTVGIDVGTQSVKLIAYDPEAGETIAIHSHPLEMLIGEGGSREQRADWWVDAIRACFSRLGSALRERIVAIGIAGQQHGFVPIADDGTVLAPVKLWCDTSTQRDCDEITAAVGGPRRCIELGGNPILAGYTASKVSWTRKHRPEAYARLATILLPHDYVNFWLTGERWMEYGDASGTGWLDVRTRKWSESLLLATDPARDLSACLPPLLAADSCIPIAPSVARELDLRRDVLVAAGGGDNMMAAIGTGNVTPGVLSMSLGTSGTLFAHAERPVVDANGAWAAFCSSTGGWLPLICTMNCTLATENMARALGVETGRADLLLAATSPGADGLLMLPFFNGERTPNLPHARAELHGIDGVNLTPANLYRAAMEGATFALRNGFDALCGAGMPFDSIRLTGGGTRSSAWRQMVSDMFAMPVEVPQQSEGAAFGAALQAVWACERARGSNVGIAAITRAHVRVDEALSAQPDPAASAAYRAHYGTFLRRLKATQEFHEAYDALPA